MRVERPVRWSVFAASLLAAGCFLSPQPDPPGIDSGDGGDGHAGRDADVWADWEPPPEDASEGGPDAGEVGDAATDGWSEYDRNCPTDPANGRTGASCADDVDCGDGFVCVPEYEADDAAGLPWTDYVGGYCMPELPPGESCDPAAAGSCPGGSTCVRTGGLGAPGEARCFDACSAVSLAGAFYGANCDCRDGYRCDTSLEVCVPGCTTDYECCASWMDVDADGLREVEEMDPVATCTARCDPHTFECVYPENPTARIGDACTIAAECPAGARCWRSAPAVRDGLPGVCLGDRCDLSGRECPKGSACVTSDPGVGFAFFCARPCDLPGPPHYDADPCGSGMTCAAADFSTLLNEDGVCLPEI
jgi:hypothetical protein